jgi:hypothetical protein
MTSTDTTSPNDIDNTPEADVYDTPWWLSITAMLAMLVVVFVVIPRLYVNEPMVGFAVSGFAVGYASYAVYRLVGIYRQPS